MLIEYVMFALYTAYVFILHVYCVLLLYPIYTVYVLTHILLCIQKDNTNKIAPTAATASSQVSHKSHNTGTKDENKAPVAFKSGFIVCHPESGTVHK